MAVSYCHVPGAFGSRVSVKSCRPLLFCSSQKPGIFAALPSSQEAELLGTKQKLHKGIRKSVDLSPVELKRYANQMEEVYRKSPSASPLGEDWRDYHGSDNWQGLVEPLRPKLRREIVRYGEFVQATCDAFDFDSHSKYCGSSRYNRHKMLEKVHLHNTGYKITKYLYAMADIHMPKFFGRSDSMDSWSNDSNWMGYLAVNTDEEEVKRLGRRDIVVAWRGTVTQLEWMENLRDILHPVGDLGCPREHAAVKVERGFQSLYTSKNDNTRYNKHSASEQLIHELRRLVAMYSTEEVSISITGHSLGGALALLSAFEIAAKGVNLHVNQRIPVSVFSFGAPRAGNSAFRNKLQDAGVRCCVWCASRTWYLRCPASSSTKDWRNMNR